MSVKKILYSPCYCILKKIDSALKTARGSLLGVPSTEHTDHGTPAFSSTIGPPRIVPEPLGTLSGTSEHYRECSRGGAGCEFIYTCHPLKI